MSAEYETIAGSVEAELEISRSRFLTHLERVESEEQAREVISSVRAAHPRARHHCTAFVLGAEARVQRSNDDGEPAGTAGAPMLDALLGSGLSDVVAVVTRYFGGVLLGAGGLTRAYRAAVAEAVLVAPRVRRSPRQWVMVEATYDVAAQLESTARRSGWLLGEAVYGVGVRRAFAVPPEELVMLDALVAELSAGRAKTEMGDRAYVDLA